jgi:hypothetical protein
MPNLDELSHDMDFTIGGETFHVHDVAPDVLLALEQQQEEEGKREGEENKPRPILERLDEQVLVFLDGNPEDVRRYKELRARTGRDAVPLWKLLEFRNLLWETQSGRPTETPSSASDAGPGRTAASLRGV